MRKKLFILLILFHSLSLPLSIHAQTATDSANSLRDSVKQKVDEELSQIKQAVSKKGFLGSITAKNEASLTLSTWTSQTRNVLVGTDLVIKLQNNRDGTPADLKTGDYILVMGDADSQNNLTATRLLVVPVPPQDRRSTFFGTVTAKTTSSLTLSLKDGQTQEIKLSSATKYAGTVKAADIAENSTVLILASSGTATPSVYTALNIHLFP